MPRQKFPSVNFFYQDFAHGVRGMPANEVGDYMRILCAIWDTEEGKLPRDDDRIRIALECRRSDVAKKVAALIARGKIYVGADGFIHNKRTERDRARASQLAPNLAASSAEVEPNLAPTSGQVAPKLGPHSLDNAAKSMAAGTASRAPESSSSSSPSFPFPESEKERPDGRVDDRPKSRPPTRVMSTAIERYHEMADRIGLPRIEALTETRQKKLKAILDKFGLGRFEEALRRVEASDFCRGLGPRGWKANLDFLIQPSTFVKLLEGHYDNRRQGPAGKPRRSDDEAETFQEYMLNEIEEDRRHEDEPADDPVAAIGAKKGRQ